MATINPEELDNQVNLNNKSKPTQEGQEEDDFQKEYKTRLEETRRRLELKHEPYEGDFFELKREPPSTPGYMPNITYYAPCDMIYKLDGYLYSDVNSNTIIAYYLRKIPDFKGETKKIYIHIDEDAIKKNNYLKNFKYLNGIFFITKHTGTLLLEESASASYYTLIEKKDTTEVPTKDPIKDPTEVPTSYWERFKQRITPKKGGSKKRFKKTRKQRKHRNSKRNNKK